MCRGRGPRDYSWVRLCRHYYGVIEKSPTKTYGAIDGLIATLVPAVRSVFVMTPFCHQKWLIIFEVAPHIVLMRTSCQIVETMV